MTAVEFNKEEPNSYQKAITCKEAQSWMGAMKEEMNSLYRNHTWVMVERPKKQSVVSGK